MGAVFSVSLPYQVRCELPRCRKAINHTTKMEIDGNMITFCSPSHAYEGEKNWEEKKRLNVRMGVPVQEEQPDAVADNLEELDKGGE